MLDSLFIGASGMHAQQMNIDVTANNLANVNTNGYKRNRIDFEDLLYRNVATASPLNGVATSGDSIGSGTAVIGTEKVFAPGQLKQTNSPFDVAINGQGFFQVVLPDGTMAYTRSGTLEVNKDGLLATVDGYPLSDMIQIPSDMKSLVIDTTGKVSAQVPGQTDPIQIGQINLANFNNPAGLDPKGNNLYAATDNSGQPTTGLPGQNAIGTLAQGDVESSNVNLVNEMVNLVVAQRAYEINSKVVQASNDMLQISNNLYR